MNTRKLSWVGFILGSLGASMAACSAESTSSPPRGSAGSGNAGVSGSSSVAGSTAQGGSPGAAGSMSASGSTSVAGSVSASGSASVAGSVGVSGSTGAGGSTAMGSCVPAVGTIADLSIDDLEDGDNAILAKGSRTGYWYTYNDGTGMQKPAPDPTGAVPFLPTAGGHSPMFAAETSGSGSTAWGAGLGFDLNNTSKKSCVYDASAYAGIKFWAKGNSAIRAMIKIPATTQPTSDSGACTGAAGMCEDHFGIDAKLTTDWAQYDLAFATLKQGGWGLATTFDKAQLIALQFQVAKGATFDFSIDDLTFY